MIDVRHRDKFCVRLFDIRLTKIFKVCKMFCVSVQKTPEQGVKPLLGIQIGEPDF